jgi:hypothetical protein
MLKNDAEEVVHVVDFEEEDVVENDDEEAVQEEDFENNDVVEYFKMEGYFEKKEIRQCCAEYFEKLEYSHPLCSTVKQSTRNKILELYFYGAIG